MRISDVEVKYLKEKYNTPLYVFDEAKIENNIDLYLNNLKSNQFETEVIYASKAFNVKEMVRLISRKGASLDCVSLGELYTAVKAGFNPKNIYFHGNNKQPEELEFALNNNIGTIVVDNLDELKLLDKIANKDVRIMIRMNVGVDAHTHKFIVTAHVDSKFGIIYNSADYKEMMNIVSKSRHIKFVGFHCHIGSQIFDLESFRAALKKLIGYLKDFDQVLELNLGGGYGVNYTKEDKRISLDVVSKTLINTCEEELKKENVKIKKLAIEPGRSIVGEAGYTIYTIGFTKKTPNKEYYFIDGGMTDNIRPALYQAKYDAVIDGKEDLEKNHVVTIAGKCCESGDLIIENIALPEAKAGDLLVTFTTGAYGYSMSSNYNKALTPAVVFVNNGKDKLVVRRMSLEELIEREI